MCQMQTEPPVANQYPILSHDSLLWHISPFLSEMVLYLSTSILFRGLYFCTTHPGNSCWVLSTWIFNYSCLMVVWSLWGRNSLIILDVVKFSTVSCISYCLMENVFMNKWMWINIRTTVSMFLTIWTWLRRDSSQLSSNGIGNWGN